jgi:tRNA-Thr(GGU) m(6)t(6)A37 methyltransferase TsaA
MIEKSMFINFKFKQIGLIKTPYTDNAPYQPVDEDKGEFRIIVGTEYARGLLNLDSFRYIYVIYYIDRLKRRPSMIVNPPWTGGKQVGLFASRSPARPNPIGISIVRLRKIINNELFVSGLDVFNNTPLLDIKPYVKELDSKDDANYGWIDDLRNDNDHLLLHIKGVPHEY